MLLQPLTLTVTQITGTFLVLMIRDKVLDIYQSLILHLTKKVSPIYFCGNEEKLFVLRL